MSTERLSREGMVWKEKGLRAGKFTVVAQWRANGLKLPHRYRGIIGLVIGTPSSPSHPPPTSLETVSRTRQPGYLVWISTSLSTLPRTFRFARPSLSVPLISRIRFAPLCSASRGPQLEIIRPIFLCGPDVFLGPLAIRASMTDVFYTTENPSRNSRA